MPSRIRVQVLGEATPWFLLLVWPLSTFPRISLNPYETLSVSNTPHFDLTPVLPDQQRPNNSRTTGRSRVR